jgi:hypothetical protein
MRNRLRQHEVAYLAAGLDHAGDERITTTNSRLANLSLTFRQVPAKGVL